MDAAVAKEENRLSKRAGKREIRERAKVVRAEARLDGDSLSEADSQRRARDALLELVRSSTEKSERKTFRVANPCELETIASELALAIQEEALLAKLLD